MKRIVRLLILNILVLILSNIHQANAQDNKDNRLWLHYFNSVQLAEKWSVDTDAAYMLMFDKPVDRFQIRSGLKYKFNKNFSLRVGGGYFYIFGNNEPDVKEIRPMQDFIGTHMLSEDRTIFIKQRARFEQQIFTDLTDSEGTSKTEVDFRMRYSFIIRKKIDNWMFGVGTEAFINFEDKNESSFFNKNRSIALVNRKLTDLMSIEAQFIREDKFAKNEGSVHHANLLRLAFRHKIK